MAFATTSLVSVSRISQETETRVNSQTVPTQTFSLYSNCEILCNLEVSVENGERARKDPMSVPRHLIAQILYNWPASKNVNAFSHHHRNG